MITIDQLLESVDLDFEPRWVTKDLDGVVSVWAKKPELSKFDRMTWVVGGDYASYERLKLAEFADKDWQECIYEVPRKTTGKIEKLEMQEIHHSGEHLVLRTEMKPATPYDMHLKINELVDAVNELKGE